MSRFIRKKTQRGAVLAIGMMLMLVLSMTVVIAMSGSIMQERMSGALRNESIADAGSDSALRDAERWIWDYYVFNGKPLGDGATTFVYENESKNPNAVLRSFRSSYDWVAAGRAYGGDGSAGSNPISSNPYQSMARVPVFVIEPLGEVSSETSGSLVSHHNGGGQEGTGNTYKGRLRYYRITARSTGGTQGVVRAQESTFTATY